MLAVGRAKSADLSELEWVHADMRAFDLDRTVALILVPGHSFLNLVTSDDQLACLQAARRHVSPGCRLVLHLDHQDLGWLGEIGGSKAGVFEPAESFVHPATGRRVRTERAWRFERSTQSAIVNTRWTELDEAGDVVRELVTGERRLHAAFRFEIEHLIARAGFAVDAVYGDFGMGPLADASSEMIFVASAT